MKPRLVIIIVAVLLGSVAALGVNIYMGNIKRQAVEGQKTIEVLVASQDIEKGMSIDDILKNRLVELKEVPRRYVATQSISSTRTIEGQVLSVPVSMGEQLTINKFRYPSEAGLSYTVPKGFIAVSIPYDGAKGAAGMIKPGDLITVFATFIPGPDGENVTKILLQKVQVIAVGVKVGAEKEGSDGKAIAAAGTATSSEGDQKTITFALTPADAEKLVFAQENGRVWLGLHTSTNAEAEAAATEGKTIKTIFE